MGIRNILTEKMTFEERPEEVRSEPCYAWWGHVSGWRTSHSESPCVVRSLGWVWDSEEATVTDSHGKGSRSWGHEVIKVMGEDHCRLGRPSRRLSVCLQEWEEKPLEGVGKEVKSMECGARMSGFVSHLCHLLGVWSWQMTWPPVSLFCHC